jgi:universal stress protein E
MNKLKNILLGTDFSVGSVAARQQAVRLARWNGAGLQAVHVVDVLAVRQYAEQLERPLMLVEKEIVEQTGRRLREWLAQSGSEVDGAAIIGMPLDGLLNRARENEASLLVLGVRGETTAHADAGNLALKCLRKAQTKVMLVHEHHVGPFKQVVACVDFSETARVAVQQARHVAEQDGSQVHFIHVFSQPWLTLQQETPQGGVDAAGKYRTVLENRLREFVGNTTGLKATFQVIEADRSAPGIADYARHTSADLLVLGSKGLSNLKYLLLGSTVERLLREVPCSVLVVRPPAVDGGKL